MPPSCGADGISLLLALPPAWSLLLLALFAVPEPGTGGASPEGGFARPGTAGAAPMGGPPPLLFDVVPI